MLVITNFKALDISLEHYRLNKLAPSCATTSKMAKLRHDIFSTINNAYNDATDGTDYYLYQDFGDAQFVFGAITPEKLVKTVKGWKKEIIDALHAALTQSGVIDKLGLYSPGTIQVDTTETYFLKKAAMELDNSWSALGEHATYLPNSYGLPYFTVLPNEGQLKDIEEHPDEYVLIEVYPK